MTYLNSREVSALSEALEALLSPLDGSDPGAWCRAVLDRVKPVLGAELGTFDLPSSDGVNRFVSDFPSSDLGIYADYDVELERKYGRTRKAAALGIGTVRTLYGDRFEEYVADTFYNEFLVARRIFPGIRLAVQTRDGIASLIFHSPRPPTPSEEERHLACARLLLPAVRAGVHAAVRLGGARGELARILDNLSDAIMVCDEAGDVLHANRSLEELLAGEPQRRTLTAALEELATRLADPPEGLTPGSFAVRDVHTGAARYRLRGNLVGQDTLGPEARVMITLERITPAPLSNSELRERFGLTAQEARVAVLLADRRRNSEIARALFISPHTARHHTESVLRKLGVDSRAAVHDRILAELKRRAG